MKDPNGLFYNADGTILIQCPPDIEGTVQIKKGTIGIYQNAFKGCEKVTAVEMPNTIERIGSNAFSGCKSMLQIEIPDTVKYIGQRAFENCNALKKIIVPSGVKELMPYTFERCVMLQKVTLNEGLKKISDFCFRDCWHLEKIIIPSSVYLIGKSFVDCWALRVGVVKSAYIQISKDAFIGCSELKKVWQPFIPETFSFPKNNPTRGLPRKIKPRMFKGAKIVSMKVPMWIGIIPESAFENCYELKSVTFENGLEKIDKQAFAQCTSLVDVKFPLSLKMIGERAFAGCTKLVSVRIPESTIVAENAFEICGVQIVRFN